MSDRRPMRFKLGDRVIFTDTVAKERVVHQHQTVTLRSEVDFFSGKQRNSHLVTDYVLAGLPWDYSKLPARRVNEGIVVGKRSISRWETWPGDEYGPEVARIPDTTRAAWIVAFGLNRKHVLVLDEHIQGNGDHE